MRSSHLDPDGTFENWWKACTDPARLASRWTPESVLFADYQSHTRYTLPEATAVDAETFAGLIAATTGRQEVRRVNKLYSAGQTAERCWDRCLIPPATSAAA